VPESCDVVIAGAGGFGREVLQYVRDTFASNPSCRVRGFIDDDPPDLASFGIAVPVLSDIDGYRPEERDRVVIAIGRPDVRAVVAEKMADRGARFLRVVHPLAYVSDVAEVGEGCIVGPFASVGAHARLGDHSVLTFYASIGHDARVGRYCALSPHSVTNGGSTIGDRAFLGAHAVVNPLQTVGARAQVAAGAVVYRSVPANALATGNPAKARPRW
jgi:sugar O-acyltransferase (sialic acid O-acetyltransferase NeuD family)